MVEPDSGVAAEEAAHAAHRAVRQARTAVDELHGALRATLGVLEDVDVDLARETVQDHPEQYRDYAAERLEELHLRCAELPMWADDLDRQLARAAQAVGEAEDLSYRHPDADPALTGWIQEMRPGLAALSEAVRAARPAAHTAAARVAAARYASQQISPQSLLECKPTDVNLRQTWTELSRADQSVELLDQTVERATEMSRKGVGSAEGLSAQARREVYQRSVDQALTHPPSGPPR